jgi:hypothetical protein
MVEVEVQLLIWLGMIILGGQFSFEPVIQGLGPAEINESPGRNRFVFSIETATFDPVVPHGNWEYSIRTAKTSRELAKKSRLSSFVSTSSHSA